MGSQIDVSKYGRKRKSINYKTLTEYESESITEIKPKRAKFSKKVKSKKLALCKKIQEIVEISDTSETVLEIKISAVNGNEITNKETDKNTLEKELEVPVVEENALPDFEALTGKEYQNILEALQVLVVQEDVKLEVQESEDLADNKENENIFEKPVEVSAVPEKALSDNQANEYKEDEKALKISDVPEKEISYVQETGASDGNAITNQEDQNFLCDELVQLADLSLQVSPDLTVFDAYDFDSANFRPVELNKKFNFKQL